MINQLTDLIKAIEQLGAGQVELTQRVMALERSLPAKIRKELAAQGADLNNLRTDTIKKLHQLREHVSGELHG